MNRRKVEISVTDHAVLRFIEREFGIDVETIRAHVAGLALNGAELQAVAVKAGRVKLICRDAGRAGDKTQVVVVTALRRSAVTKEV